MPRVARTCLLCVTLVLPIGIWPVGPSPRSAQRRVGSAPVQFVDVAQQAGLTVLVVNGGEQAKKYIYESTGSGVAALDYDRDGWPDIFVVNGSRLEGFPEGSAPTNHLFHNNHNGTFTDVTVQSGLAHDGWGQGVCAGDYDNDGYDDLYVTYFGGPNVLYHNNGDGTFTDASQRAGLHDPKRNWGSGCAFLDYDRDGKLDLFVAGYVEFDFANPPQPGSGPNCLFKGVAVYCGPRGLAAGENRLFHNNGNGAFTDASVTSGIRKAAHCYGLGVLTGDFENRGWPDIYVACDSVASLFFRNNGDGTFTERGVEAGVAYNEDGMEQAGMGVSAGDYNGDGLLDILKTNFDEDTLDLYRNEGNGQFSFQTYDAKLGFNRHFLSWGGGFFDYDNDGFPDIFIATGHVYPELERHNHLESPLRQRSILYHQTGNAAYDDVTSIAGPAFESRRVAHGAAFLDFDNDGNVDIVVNNQNDSPALLRNDGGSRNHWISIRTVGAKSNRDGIGARVIVTAGGRRQIDEVRSGGSYLSQNDLRLHFGLGQAAKIDQLEIHWPSGAADKLENIPADQFLVVQEGKGLAHAK